MRICIEGKDERANWLRKLAQEQGHELPDKGPWELIFLALPRSELPARLLQLPPGQKIICGKIEKPLEEMAKDRGWQLLKVLQDETFARENALLTANGALWAAMKHKGKSLQGMTCAVLGYGRIGKQLVSLLRNLGAKTYAAARREESRKEAGPDSVDFAHLPKLLPSVQVVFNTIPSPVLGASELALLPPDALLIELASPPYGIDKEATLRLGLSYYLESGLPGRYCPREAALALLRYAQREVHHE